MIFADFPGELMLVFRGDFGMFGEQGEWLHDEVDSAVIGIAIEDVVVADDGVQLAHFVPGEAAQRLHAQLRDFFGVVEVRRGRAGALPRGREVARERRRRGGDEGGRRGRDRGWGGGDGV